MILIFLFQRNIPDSYIDSGDTRITKAYSINNIENSEEYKWFSEGNTVYFSAPSTDFAVNPDSKFRRFYNGRVYDKMRYRIFKTLF